jgi:excisionase family DNA binding protein
MLKTDLIKGAKAAAEYLGENPRRVYNMTEKGQIPFIRKGSTLYFRKSELDAAFRSSAA